MIDIVKKIPRDKAFYIVGFSDGEASFNTSFRIRDDYLLGWKITPVFNISQKQRDILAVIKRYLNCGTIRYRNDDCWVYQVENRTALTQIIIPFFEKYPLQSSKLANYQDFHSVALMMKEKKHLTTEGLTEIINIKSGMNRGRV